MNEGEKYISRIIIVEERRNVGPLHYNNTGINPGICASSDQVQDEEKKYSNEYNTRSG